MSAIDTGPGRTQRWVDRIFKFERDPKNRAICECGHGGVEGLTWSTVYGKTGDAAKHAQFQFSDYHLINEGDDDARCRAPFIDCPCVKFVPKEVVK